MSDPFLIEPVSGQMRYGLHFPRAAADEVK
jgi:hypothetical protein